MLKFSHVDFSHCISKETEIPQGAADRSDFKIELVKPFVRGGKKKATNQRTPQSTQPNGWKNKKKPTVLQGTEFQQFLYFSSRDLLVSTPFHVFIQWLVSAHGLLL